MEFDLNPRGGRFLRGKQPEERRSFRETVLLRFQGKRWQKKSASRAPQAVRAYGQHLKLTGLAAMKRNLTVAAALLIATFCQARDLRSPNGRYAIRAESRINQGEGRNQALKREALRLSVCGAI